MTYRLDIPGWMSEEALKAIENLAQCVPEDGLVIEVGCFLGRSTWALCKSVHPTVTVVAIDKFDWLPEHGSHEMMGEPYDQKAGAHSLFSKNTADCRNLNVYRGPSLSYMPSRKANLIFIDGDHANPYVALDIGYFAALLCEDGMLSGDDYGPDHPDVVSSVDALAKSMGRSVKTFGGRLWGISFAATSP